MKVSEYTSCSTSNLKALDRQLIDQINKLSPVLADFSKLPIQCQAAVHPYLQPSALIALSKAIKARPDVKMVCNSAYRTLAQQAVLYSHYQHGRCGIVAAAKPGYSNHNSGLAIDIEDASGWRPYLERYGWKWIGSFDPMHFDYQGGGSIDLRSLSIKAFQVLWNTNNPNNKLAEDGQYGPATEKALFNTLITGFNLQRLTGQILGQTSAESAAALSVAESTKPEPNWETLSKGMSGDRIRQLQEALLKHGHPVIVDGDFGKDTYTKVRWFQSKLGLCVDGVVGTLTAKELGLI